jgi:hypothetical protein
MFSKAEIDPGLGLGQRSRLAWATGCLWRLRVGSAKLAGSDVCSVVQEHVKFQDSVH